MAGSRSGAPTGVRRQRTRQILGRRAQSAAALAAMLLWIAGCGTDEAQQRPTGIAALMAGTASENEPGPGKRGGTITVLSAGDVDTIDPGFTYYFYTMGMVVTPVHRTLLAYRPDQPDEPVPDLATSRPEIAADGKTVTVRIRQGVHFSPPVNREVTSADVKYAIERGFTRNVPNGYAHAYFGDIVGAPAVPGAYEPIAGIETPDDSTIVFKLSRGTGRVLAGALVMPLTAPVPREYAARYDRDSPSTYGNHEVATGPYMVENEDDGDVVGYKVGQRIHLVRNPNDDPATDFRPAFADEFDIRAGNESSTAARRVLRGHALIGGDLGAPPYALRRALIHNKPQISLVPSGAFGLVALDTSQAPFDDINVRKAVVAGFDRNEVRRLGGGDALGMLAQHYLPPGIPGYEESGGAAGPTNLDFMQTPDGDAELAAKYFRAAGFASGRYEGKRAIFIIGDAPEPARSTAVAIEEQFHKLGFRTKLRLFSHETNLTKFCGRPDSGVDVCTGVGWGKDFADPQTMLDATFNGDNIHEAGNSNWPELDDPDVNARMDAAALVTDPKERARAWADINKRIVALAPGIPLSWGYQPALASADVRGVQSPFTTTWDLSFTSLR
jgi:peptide/nickel transport system substrate-binding protein